jgi:hypothetical protein
MPVCAKCNGKNNQHFSMSDTRPDAWRSNFAKLVAHSLGLKVMLVEGCAPLPKNEQGCAPLPTQTSVETNRVIEWENIEFVKASELREPLKIDVHTPPLLADILATLRELIDAGKNHGMSISPPRKNCQDDLQRLIKQHGCKNFSAAGHEFLRQEGWFDGDNGYRTDKYPWQTFADNFDTYLADHAQREERMAKRAAEQAEQNKRALAQEAEAARKRRIDTFRSVVSIPADCVILTDDDRAWIATVQAFGDGEPTDDDVEKSTALTNRYCCHTSDVEKRNAKLDRVKSDLFQQVDAARTEGRLPEAWVEEFNTRFLSLFYGIRHADSEETLLKLTRAWRGMLQEAANWDGTREKFDGSDF